MGEQSHKREMMDAVRGDFERLRARRERGRVRSEPRAAPEKVVLTPAQQPEPEPAPEPTPAGVTEVTPEPDPPRSWRWVRRRRT